jgi:hypothetical protein
MFPPVKSMATICGLAIALSCVAAILGVALGYAMVWGLGAIWQNCGSFICFGIVVGFMLSIPVMTVGLIVSEQRALASLMLGAVAVGVLCWTVIYIACWSILHIT